MLQPDCWLMVEYCNIEAKKNSWLSVSQIHVSYAGEKNEFVKDNRCFPLLQMKITCPNCEGNPGNTRGETSSMNCIRVK